MKKALLCLTIGALCQASVTAYADGAYHSRKDYKDVVRQAVVPSYDWTKNLSGNLTLTSNYIFRGISQTTNNAAVQGGMTYAFPWGIYVNAWGSNVRYKEVPDATVEFDAILGVSNEIYKDFTYDINVARFYFPKANELEYNEVNGALTYKFFTYSMGYTANVYNVHKTGIYYNGKVSFDIPSRYLFNVDNVNFEASYGHYSLPRAAGNSYNDYMAAISKKIKNYTFMVQWTDTDGRQKNPPFDRSQVLASVSADFS